MRAREPAGEEGACHSLASRERIAGERERVHKGISSYKSPWGTSRQGWVDMIGGQQRKIYGKK